MYKTLFWCIIAILVLNFLIDAILDYLNEKSANINLPKEVENIYDAEEYRKQQEYFKVNNKFSAVSDIFSFIVIMLMFFFFGFAFVDNVARGCTDNWMLVSLIFFGILYFANEIITIPFSWHQIDN